MKELELRRLKELALFINGRGFKKSEWKNEGLPIIRIQNLNDPNKEYNYFNGDLEERHIVNKGDLLLSWSGSIDCYVWNGRKAALNQHIFKVIPRSDNITKEFLFYAIKEKIEEMKLRVHGSTMKHITKKKLEEIKIIIPNKNCQNKIVSVLKKADRIREKRNLSNELTENFIISKFIHLFGDPNINPRKWVEYKLKEIIDCFDGKRVPIRKSDRVEGNVPYYGANGRAGWVDKHIFNEPLLLLAEDASDWGKLKKCSYRIDGKSWVNNHSHVLKNNDNCNLEYLEYVLNILDLDGYITGSTRGKLTKGKMQNIIIPLPPLELQNQFAGYVKLYESLKNKQKILTEELNKFSVTLLKKSFNEPQESVC